MSRRRVLVVDDDPGFLVAAEKALCAAGFEVASARDYRDALPLLEQGGPFDLLFTDVVMPDRVNGFALARMARMIDQRIRVLYTTGYDVPPDEAVGKILRKPLRDDQIVSEVYSALAA